MSPSTANEPVHRCRAKTSLLGVWLGVAVAVTGSGCQLPVVAAAQPRGIPKTNVIMPPPLQKRCKRTLSPPNCQKRMPWQRLGVGSNKHGSNIHSQVEKEEEPHSPKDQPGPIASFAFAQSPAWTVRCVVRGGDATITSPSNNSKLLASLVERTVSAVIMLVLLVVWIDSFREKGMILLVLIIQLGLFREGTNAILSDITYSGELLSRAQKESPSASSIQWWWCAAYMLALDGPRILTAKRSRASGPIVTAPTVYLAAFSMMALGMVSFVLALNSSVSFSYEFRIALQELASYHAAALFLIVPSSFWIATIQEYGMKWVLYAGYLVALNDTMAYVFGASFGKHPLLPAISPKKTWEGFWGAFATTMLLSGLFWEKFNLGVDYSHALVLAAYASLIAPFGGFLASIVKRANGKKDFSNMIAGHGGFIDRLDCHLFTAPFVYLYLRYAISKS